MRTWVKEALVMATVLALSTGLAAYQEGSFSLVHGLSFMAVLVTFLHAQVSDRLREYAEKLKPISPDCAYLERVYYLTKELLWVATFMAMRNYPALIGTVGFILYQRWRKWWRSRK